MMIEWGGDGPLLHFAHANGFPPRSYGDLLEPLTADFSVISFESRPMWPDARPEDLRSWNGLVEDLIASLDQRGSSGILGVGHSLGAVLSALAAVRRPDLFKALVLLDPVFFSGMRSAVWRMMKATGRERHLPLYAGAVRRRDHWPDRAAVKASWSSRPIFRSWRPSALAAYIEHGVAEDDRGGVRLRYPKMWEARIFELTPREVWSKLRRLAVPTLVLRGEHSDTFLAGAQRRLLKTVEGVRCEEVTDAGHLFPMERPQETSDRVRDFLHSRP